MLNAPLPLVSMSWSRLLLLIFVLSFVLSSLVSLMMIEDGDDWAAAGDRQHAALLIAHSQLPPELQQQAAGSHHTHHKQQQAQHHSISNSASANAADALHGGGAGQQAAGADGGGGGGGDGDGDAEAAQGLSLSPLLFSGLAADEAAIEAMEQRVREARAAQQRTAETAAAASAAAPPPSQFASHALALSNLTQDCMAHIALLPSPALPAAPSSPSSLPAASSVLSLVLVQHWTASSSPLPPLTSSLSRYTRPAGSFFLSSPPSSRHVVTDDWAAAFTQPVPGLVSHLAVSSSHDWSAVAYTQHSPPHDYSLHLRVVHDRDGEQQTVDALLAGHQPVTGLSLSVSNGSCCRLLVSRRMDETMFKAWEARVEDGQPLTLQQAEDGPAVNDSASASASGRDVLRLLLYAERADSEGVVVIESDERGNSQSPFVAAIYTRMAQRDSGDNSSHSSAAGGADTAQLLQLGPSISSEGLTAAATTDAGGNDSLALNGSEAVSARVSDSSELSVSPSASSSDWRLTSTLPRYRSMATVHPIPASALVTASSASHRFLAYGCTPFLTAVDASHQFAPIEIIHLQPSTVFSHLAVSAAGGLIAIVDQQRDVILLRRTAAAAHRHSHALPSLPSSPAAPPSAPAELRSQWVVALELILPQLLRRLQVVSAQLLTLDRRTEAERETPSDRDRASKDGDSSGSVTEAESAAGGEEAAAVSSAASRDNLYLCLLFEGGVVASFALDVLEHELQLTAAAADSPSTQSVDGSVLGSLSVSGVGSGVELLVELLLLNWELIIGLTVIVFSAAFSLQMSSITRAWQQQTPAR